MRSCVIVRACAYTKCTHRNVKESHTHARTHPFEHIDISSRREQAGVTLAINIFRRKQGKPSLGEVKSPMHSLMSTQQFALGTHVNIDPLRTAHAASFPLNP